LAALALSVLCAANATAVPITYTTTATIDGSLNGVSFTDKLFTVTATGDTTQVGFGNSTFGIHVFPTFSVAGVGSGSLFGLTWTAFATLDVVGFALAGDQLFNVFNAAFAGYNLATPIDVTGPVTPSIPPNPGGWDTTAGPFIMTGGGNDGRFTAVVGDATPIPGAFPMFATGLGALGLLGWRRKRKAAALVA
jgi:hypothetical protein